MLTMPRAKKRVSHRTHRHSHVSSRRNSRTNSQVSEERHLKWKPFWVIVRIITGFLFLWPFLDKTFGFGITTTVENAWIHGGSPTAGFLLHGTTGPFASIFQSIASSPVVEWLFMVGLLFVGLSMILGVAMKPAAIAGTVMVFLMYLSELPPANNPFVDEHWFYAFALIASALTNSGDYFGFGKCWKSFSFVKKCKFLE